MTDELEHMSPAELRARLAATRQMNDDLSKRNDNLAKALDEARATTVRHSLLFAKWERLKVKELLLDIRRNLIEGDVAPQAFIDRIDALLAKESTDGA